MTADPSGSGTGSSRAAAAGEPMWRACLGAGLSLAQETGSLALVAWVLARFGELDMHGEEPGAGACIH